MKLYFYLKIKLGSHQIDQEVDHKKNKLKQKNNKIKIKMIQIKNPNLNPPYHPKKGEGINLSSIYHIFINNFLYN